MLLPKIMRITRWMSTFKLFAKNFFFRSLLVFYYFKSYHRVPYTLRVWFAFFPVHFVCACVFRDHTSIFVQTAYFLLFSTLLSETKKLEEFSFFSTFMKCVKKTKSNRRFLQRTKINCKRKKKFISLYAKKKNTKQKPTKRLVA